MMMGVYEFGRFTLDPAEHRLRADGAPVPLGPTAFGVLLTLVERAGSIVTKDDLISRVWGYSDVEENRLYVHINALRKIVGRDCIINKQGRGYRFQAQVRRSGNEVEEPARRPEGNLPALWTAAEGSTRLIGRDRQLRDLTALLARAQLITLTGPGGVGKTRLAVRAASESAADFADGVWLVELGALTNPDFVPGAVAAALGITVGRSEAPLNTLATGLARKTLLIVLDNCEHLLGVCARLCETLGATAPGVKILATSRQGLSCSGELIFEVPPLELPNQGAIPADGMRGAPAVELFIERASSVDARFGVDENELSIVAKICRRLDGLPLAIEMVASWAGVLGLEELDAKLDGSLRAWLRAKSTAPRRHSTLSATLEWSHGLLSGAEQTVLRRLSVFAGSFTMSAAEAVAADGAIQKGEIFEHLACLIRKSMIAVAPRSRSQRYHLLQTTRSFMLERLADSNEAEAVRRRHANYVLQSLQSATHEWETTSDAVWLERYGVLLDDLRSSLDWAMRQDVACDDAVALAAASWPLWQELSLLVEGRRRLGAAVARLHHGTPQALEAQLRRGFGELCLNTAAIKTAHEELARAVELYRLLNKGPDCGGTLAALAFAFLMLGQIDEAERVIAEALGLLEQAGWLRTLGVAHSVQLCIEVRLGHFGAARSAGHKAVRLCELAGANRSSLVVAANLAEAALEMGDIDDAVSAGRSLATRLRQSFHSDMLGSVLGILAGALTARGDLEEALAAAREAAPLLRDYGMLFWLFDHLALRAGLAGRVRDAALIAGYADAAYSVAGQPREPIGYRAVERLNLALRDELTDREIADLGRKGASLTEEQALRLALHD